MRVKRLILSTIIASASICAFSQKGLDAPMTKAVMNVYQQLLEEDPTDYETYYRRACEYYKHNQYNLALSDINNALKYTPESETIMRIEQLTLRANIYQMTDCLEEALLDLNNAYALDPTSYVTLYQKANLEYQLGKYTDAKADFLRLQRINNRSQEALIGLARIAVKENNLGLANEYIDQAVAIAPSNSDIYVRRASVRMMMGNDNGAVDDLILAISTDKNNTKALQELVKLSDTNYSAVMTGLSNAIRQAPKVGMFYYIRAVIAQSHYRYLAALSDYHKIINEKLYNYAGIYKSISECYYALGKYEEALDNVNYALSASSANENYNVLKAEINRILGNSNDAILNADRVLEKNPNANDALIQKSLVLVDLKKYEEATALIGEASLNDADNAYYYMLRAWVLDTFMNQKTYANAFYQRVIDMETNAEKVESLKGFAFLFSGCIDEANAWMENILNHIVDSDGYEYYIGTCFYAWSGNHDNAFECMKLALENGYANYTDWTKNNDGRINVDPIRNDKRFNELLSQFSIIFN